MFRRARSGGRTPAFAAALGIVLAYGVRGGGSYDPVVFAEHGLIAWWIVGLMVAVGVLPRVRPHRTVLILLAALGLYTAWTGASLLWTDSSELTWGEFTRSIDLLGLLVLAATTLDARNWRSAAGGLVAGAGVICVIAVGSRLAPGVFGHDRIDAVFHFDRLSRPFGYWNSVAAWGAMTCAAGLIWSAHERSAWLRALALALVPLAGATVYLTYSRAGIGGVALAALAALVLSRNRFSTVLHLVVAAVATGGVVLAIRTEPSIARNAGATGAGRVALILSVAMIGCAAVATVSLRFGADQLRTPWKLARAGLAIGGIMLVVVLIAFGPHFTSRAWHSFTRFAPAPNSADPTSRYSTLSSSRYPLWRSSMKAFDAHPITGLGAGTIEFWWNRYGSDGEFVRNTHDLWIENLAVLGVPGGALILLVVASAGAVGVAVRRRARRSTSAGAAAAALAVMVVWLLHATFDWMWQSTATTVLAFGGIAVAGGRLASPIGPIRLQLRVVPALAALVACSASLPIILSGLDIERSQAAFRTGDPSAALMAARAAVSAEPWSASAYEQLGLVLESRRSFMAARAAVTQAILDERDNYAHYLIRARIDVELRQTAAASADLARAKILRPRASAFTLAPYFDYGVS